MKTENKTTTVPWLERFGVQLTIIVVSVLLTFAFVAGVLAFRGKFEEPQPSPEYNPVPYPFRDFEELYSPPINLDGDDWQTVVTIYAAHVRAGSIEHDAQNWNAFVQEWAYQD